MTAIPKPKTERNSQRLEFVRLAPCLITEYGSSSNGLREHRFVCTTLWSAAQKLFNFKCCHPHHVYDGVSGGVGIKPDDFRTVPLCLAAHEEFHRIGKQSFEAKYGLDLEAHIRRINREFAKAYPVSKPKRQPKAPKASRPMKKLKAWAIVKSDRVCMNGRGAAVYFHKQDADILSDPGERVVRVEIREV